MALTCPYGSELKPGVEQFILGSSFLVEIAQQFLEIPLIGNALDFISWTLFDLQYISDNGPFDYPVITTDDYLSGQTIVPKLLAYVNAWLWDKFCQCQTPPGG